MYILLGQSKSKLILKKFIRFLEKKILLILENIKVEIPEFIQLWVFRIFKIRLSLKNKASISYFYNPHIYLTLRCNLRCPYCANGKFYDKSDMGYHEQSINFWADKINNFKEDVVIFTGGEPLLYKSFFELLNKIDKKKKVHIYSNLSLRNLKKNIGSFKRVCKWWLSYHPAGGADLETLINNIKILRNHNQLLNLQAIPSQLNLKKINSSTINTLNNEHISLLLKKSIQTQIKTEKKVKVECKYVRKLYSPDGIRYHCVYGLITQNPKLVVNHQNVESVKICTEYGNCSPCDEVAEIKEIKE